MGLLDGVKALTGGVLRSSPSASKAATTIFKTTAPAAKDTFEATTPIVKPGMLTKLRGGIHKVLGKTKITPVQDSALTQELERLSNVRAASSPTVPRYTYRRKRPDTE